MYLIRLRSGNEPKRKWGTEVSKWEQSVKTLCSHLDTRFPSSPPLTCYYISQTYVQIFPHGHMEMRDRSNTDRKCSGLHRNNMPYSFF